MDSEAKSCGPSLPANAYARTDESDDALFYRRDRFVNHLDAVALETAEWIIGRLVVEDSPVLLDLMASWDSHIPGNLRTEEVIGLGMNRGELLRNSRLSRFVLHDLNRDPHLPFEDAAFDIVLNTVSVDYLTRPREVFVEVGRVLKPGGLFLVIFSNRMFPEKAVKIWQDSTEEERVRLVQNYFTHTGEFEAARTFASEGKPRPADDKYAQLGIPSDPVFAVYAEKKGGVPDRKRPHLSEDTACNRQTANADNLCPHCGQRLSKWATPNDPFSTWDTPYLYICFNDSCPFLVKGWSAMRTQGNRGLSCRFTFDPARKTRSAIPIISLHALKERIVEEEPEN